MRKRDVLEFAAHLEDNIFVLHEDLLYAYRHGMYEQFYVHDPKRRQISKATVRDRIVHQAVVQIIEPIVEPSFIFDSYASRAGKGTHAAVARFSAFLRRVSRNNHRTVYILKCDIRKFFDSVRHGTLLVLLRRILCDDDCVSLCAEIVQSYASAQGVGRGLPLGNVTSQIFANIYLNAFDHFIKEELQMKWYVRFCDDFLIAHNDENVLRLIIPRLQLFFDTYCGLVLHPNKVVIRKYTQGIDVLGTVVRPYTQTLRTKTKRRMMRRLRCAVTEYQADMTCSEQLRATLQSYLGLLTHGNQYDVRCQFGEEAWKMFFPIEEMPGSCVVAGRDVNRPNTLRVRDVKSAFFQCQN